MRRESFHHHGIAGSVRLDARHAECLHPGLKGRAHMDILLQQVINGLVLGSMYALIALGYTMVYGIIQLINFAHGEVLMVGALTSWSCIGLMQEAMPGAPGWLILLLATVIACVVAAALNFVIEKVAYRRLRSSRSEERRVGKECRSRWSP